MGSDDKNISRIYALTKKGSPPMAIDSDILSYGRKAVEKKSSFQFMDWFKPVATAMSVVLSVTLLIKMNTLYDEGLFYDKPVGSSVDVASIESDDSTAMVGERKAKQAQPAKKDIAPESFAVAEQQAPMAASQSVKLEKRSNLGIARNEAGMLAQDSVAEPEAPARIKSPISWMADIIELHKTGKVKEAEGSLLAFQRAHPDYILPQYFLDAISKK